MSSSFRSPSRERILIVDDRPENLVALRAILAEVDVDLIEASSGESALRATLHYEFAVAILDVQMPGMDGYELAYLLHGDPRTHRLPIIFVTAAYGDEKQIYQGYEVGAVEYIVKPYDPRLLISKVRIFLELYRAHAAIAERNQLLVAAEERYRSLVMTIPDIVYVIDEAGRFTFLNGAITLLGYTADELIGQHFSKIIHPADVAAISRESALAHYAPDTLMPGLFDERRKYERRTTGLEIRLLPRQGGDKIPALLHPISDECITAEINSAGFYSHQQGSPQFILLGTVGVIRDISDRKRTESELTKHRQHLQQLVEVQTAELEERNLQLQELNQNLTNLLAERTEAKQAAETANIAKSRFLATMSHEIRTPLNAIVGMTYMLGLTKLDKDQREQLATVETASRTLLAQINDILDLAKIEAGEVVFEEVCFDLPGLFRSIDRLFRPDILAKGLLFILPENFLELPNYLLGDPVKIHQMLINLIGNAVKFTDSGEISVSLQEIARKEQQLTLRFTVRDTGIGIAAKVLPTLFNPFTQADASTTRLHGGTGLGLSLVRQLAERMGGRTGVESVVKQGSQFWFELPLVITTAPTYPLDGEDRLHSMAEIPFSCRLPDMKVLVVDDSRMNLDVCQRLLSYEGAHPVLCQSGSEALREFHESGKEIDVVLMDIQMPEMDGYETTQKLRQLPFGEKIPIIALTAGTMASERERALAAGMNDFITKPIDPIILIRIVRRHIEEYRNKSLPIFPQVNQTAEKVWSAIPGLTLAPVQARLINDFPLFLNLLDRFISESTMLINQTQTNFLNIAPQLHRFRGQASNIGAIEIGQEAANLEQLVLKEQLTQEVWDNFTQRLGNFLASLSHWRMDQDNRVSVVASNNFPLDIELLETLLVQLTDQELGALENFQMLAPTLRNKLSVETYQIVEQAVHSLDFAVALTKLKPLTAGDTI